MLKLGRKLLICLAIFLLTFSLTQPILYAQSTDAIKALETPFYDGTSSDVCSLVSSDNSATATGGPGIWQSGLSPPYILEQFARETLKSIAAKRGVSESDTVTKEHVVALVAFMFGEGGDINNQDLFNPLNTGIDAPDLLASANAVNGVQSFKSFDAGVEATARTMTGSNQKRLADVLTQPGSSAKQFMYALTYYNKFPGNKFWAAASLPPNQDSYYQQRLTLVQEIKNDYKGTAGLVIGTPEKEFISHTTDPSKLQFQDGGDSTTDSSSIDSSAGCGNSGVASSDIVQTAINLSWPVSHGLTPKQEYLDALRQYNPTIKGGADCGVFVSTVMHATGADPDYPSIGTGQQEAYVRAHPEKYDVVNSVSSTADLQPGDIMIVNAGGGGGASGHTFIFIGRQADGNDEASASLDTRMPSRGKAIVADDRGNYIRVRLK